MEQNKLKKAKRIFMNYMMVMQFIVTAIALALFGYYLGNRINKESNLSTVLTAVGLGLGVMIGFITVIYMIKSEERYERSTRH
ncbi:MAG: AtpZ/AtpI family protein [Acholeplasmataceae bacterium]